MKKNYVRALIGVAMVSLMVACQSDKPTQEPEPEKPDTEKPDTEKPDTEKPDTEKPLELKFDTVVSDFRFYYELTDVHENMYEVSKVTIDGVEHQIDGADYSDSAVTVGIYMDKYYYIGINYLETGADRRINIWGKHVDINITQKPMDKAMYEKYNLVVDGIAQTLELSDRGFYYIDPCSTSNTLMLEGDNMIPPEMVEESETLVTVRGKWAKMYRYYIGDIATFADIKIELQENNTGKDRVLFVHNSYSYKRHTLITQKSL